MNNDKQCKVVCVDLKGSKDNHTFTSMCDRYTDVRDKYIIDPLSTYNQGDCLVYTLPDKNNSYLMFVHIDDTSDRSAAYSLYDAYTNIITLCSSMNINNIEFPNQMSQSLSRCMDDELFSRRFTSRINKHTLSYTR